MKLKDIPDVVWLMGGAALVLWWIKNHAPSIELPVSLKKKYDTLKQGLSNPLDAEIAFLTGGLVVPNSTGDLNTTNNFNYYLKWLGITQAQYIDLHKTGKWNYQAYDSSQNYMVMYYKKMIF